MLKRSKLISIVGSVAIGVVCVLVVLFGLIAGGVVSGGGAKLIVSSESAEKIYDGNPLTCEKWNLVGGKLKKGYTVKAVFTAARTDAGTSQNTFSVSVSDGDGTDKTEEYAIEYRFGQLTVSPLQISLSTNSASKVYDGTPLTHSGYRITKGKLLQGHSLSLETTGSITEAGKAENTFTALVEDAAGKDVTDNYEFVAKLGALTVQPKKISLISDTAVKVYDGTPLTCENWKFSSDSALLKGHAIALRVSGSQTIVGQSKNSLTDVVITDGEKEVTYNYSVTLLAGDLVVTPRPLTVRSASDSKLYDGRPLTNGAWEIVSETKPAQGQKTHVAVSGTRTEAGESPNTIAEVVVTDTDGKDVSANYAVRLQEGALVVKSPDGSSGGGSEGGSGGSLAEGGEIGGMPSELDVAAARIYSERTGTVYLRYMSYGDYAFNKWLDAQAYSRLIDSKYCLNYLTGIALENAGFESMTAKIEPKDDCYLLPSYLDRDEYDYKIQTSDVKYDGPVSGIYSLYYYAYDYLVDGAEPLKGRLGNYGEAERQYRQYVYDHYLSLPSATKTYFEGLASREGFARERDAIAAAAAYIRGAASYNLAYDKRLDGAGDIAVSFLETYREGICQHYATAATALYRAMGIPARYVVGYLGHTQAGEWTTVTQKDAHAWVEVYLDGIGWVQVEVTGGSGASEVKRDLTIAPVDLSKKYDGITPLTAGTELTGLAALLEQGYTYAAAVSGSRLEVGIGESKIESFTLYDPQGKDVTQKFDITFKRGKLHVYVKEIKISTPSASKIYDGLPLDVASDGWTLDGDLIYGHSVGKFALRPAPTNAGSYVNSFEIVILDEEGRDATYMYKIVRECGTLNIEVRGITIVAHSAKKPYDGAPLTCGGYDLITDLEGGVALGRGDRIEVTLSGSQTEIGRSENTVVKVVVLNAAGEDVTANYVIEYQNGELQVTPA